MKFLTLLLTVALWATAAPAQDWFDITDFQTASNIALVPNATLVGTNLRVSASALSDRGAAWCSNLLSVGNGFETRFTFQFSSFVSGGGDGLAFVIHNDPRGPMALGRWAGSMGYAPFANDPPGMGFGIASSLAIEIDTFQNNNVGDPSGNHVSIHTNGVLENNRDEAFSIGSAVIPTTTTNFSDGQPHEVRIRYVPGAIEVFIDGSSVLGPVAWDFATGGTHVSNQQPVGGLGLPADEFAWVGFTASGGASYENHDILDWTFASFCWQGTVSDGQGGLADVLTVNGVPGSARTVRVAPSAPLTFAVAQPPASTGPANIFVAGLIGTPAMGNALTLPFIGTFCFTPAPLATTPDRFTLVDGFAASGLLPATPTPWSFALPGGIPVPVTLTLQGLVQETSGALAVTNGIVLVVQ